MDYHKFVFNQYHINDKFGPLSKINQTIKIFRIYNRWGQLIFETKDFNHKWDGSFDGLPQPSGTYIYYLLVDCNGESVVLKGNVTLLR